MLVLLSESISTLRLKELKELAQKAWSLDLSSTDKTETEPFSVLTRFCLHNVREENVLKHTQIVQKHFFYSFLIICNESTSVDLICNSSGLNCTRMLTETVDVIVASATLDNWCTTIVNLSKETSTREVIQLMNDLQMFFERRGLGFLFNTFEKIPKLQHWILK